VFDLDINESVYSSIFKVVFSIPAAAIVFTYFAMLPYFIFFKVIEGEPPDGN
jgi:hypothetical protein